MKRLLWVLLLGLVIGASLWPRAQAQAPVGPGQQVICPSFATFTAGTTNSIMVAAVTGKTIFICGWHITNTGTSGVWSFLSGTGANCGTTTATLVPAQNVTSNAPSADHIDYAVMAVPISMALCISASNATISGLVYFNQF